MKHYRWFALAASVALLGAAACSNNSSSSDPDGSPGDGGEASLSGAVAKGPFVLGSDVSVSILGSQDFQPTGQVFLTNTTNDLGEFNLTVPGDAESAYAALQAQGFYYNEVTGELSDAQITLRAFYQIAGSGTQTVYVNLITHLTASRVQALLANPSQIKDAFDTGDAFADAIAQAEAELADAIGIGPTNFDPGRRGTEMNILGDPAELANAYLFTVSAVVAKAAELRGGGEAVDANLQELVNLIASDLADDGLIGNASVFDLIQEAEAAVDSADVEALLRSRLEQLGQVDPVVPDMDLVLDSNNDGQSNAQDGYPCGDGVHHPDQVCLRQAHLGEAFVDSSESALFDLDGDGNLDILHGSLGLSVFYGDGAGSVSTQPERHEITQPTDSGTRDVSARRFDLVDVDPDTGGGFTDVVAATGFGLVVLPGQDPTAGSPFGAPVFFGDRADIATVDVATADLDGDGDLDVISCERVSSETSFQACTQVTVFLNEGGLSFGIDGAPNSTLDSADVAYGFGVADFDGDGTPDLLLGLNEEVRDPNGALIEINAGPAALHLGAGDGTFVAAPAETDPASDTQHNGLRVSDLDDDQDMDAVLFYGAALRVLRNDGTGNFAIETATLPLFDGPAGGTEVGATLADFDLDGQVDLISTGEDYTDGEPVIAVVPGAPSGFGESLQGSVLDLEVLLDWASPPLVGDMDGDSLMDIVFPGLVLVQAP